MEKFDDVAVKKMDALLRAISDVDKFDYAGDELDADDLDMVTGGVTVPDFQEFLRYVQERKAYEEKN